MNYKNTDGPFVLIFIKASEVTPPLTNNYYDKYEGKYVRVSWSSTEGEATPDLKKAKIFSTVSSARGSSYAQTCKLIPIDISIRGEHP